MGVRLFPKLSLLLALTLAGCSGEDVGSLPALGAKMDETTVSGISSGAYMAGQFQMAHANLVTGAAIIAGVPTAAQRVRSPAW